MRSIRVLVFLIPPMLMSCSGASRERPLSKPYLRLHEGDRVEVAGRANDTKASSSISTPTVTFRLDGFRWEDGEVGQTRRVSGNIRVVPEHIAPELEEEITTDEPAGELIPEQFHLRDVIRLPMTQPKVLSPKS